MQPPQSLADEAGIALAALQPLLESQAQALRDGDADALPVLEARMRPYLAVLSRRAARGPLPAEVLATVRLLQARSAAAQAMLARRLQVVDRALEALGSASPGLQDSKLRTTYGRAPSGFSRGGFGSGLATA